MNNSTFALNCQGWHKYRGLVSSSLMELIDYSFCSKPFIYTIISWFVFVVIRLCKYKLNFVGVLRQQRTLLFHTLEVNIGKEVIVEFRSRKGNQPKVVLVTKLGKAIPEYVPYNVIQKANELLIVWKDQAELTIRHRTQGQHDVYEFHWLASSNRSKLEDHVMMAEGGHWYGAGHVFQQPWPLEKWYYKLGAFITKESFPFRSNYGELLEAMWLSSSGVAIHVDFDVPLFVSTNFDYDRTIRLVSAYKSPYRSLGSPTFLKYTVIQTGADVREAFASLRKAEVIAMPTDIPDELMFRRPIWSTWAEYKKDITQDKVLEFAAAIRKNGFSAAQLEIDDDWTPHYGDWQFDRKKFADPKAMMDVLRRQGYRVTLWIHPFASPQSSAFWSRLKVDRHSWLTWRWLGIPALVSWWNGYGALLDVTNPTAVTSFKEALRRLAKDYGVTSFKVDAGEASRISTLVESKTPFENPNVYTKLFAELAFDLDRENRAQELRVGAAGQHLAMFYRLQDKDSTWSSFNGIKTVIPHVLTQGLLGYPFVLPDMIGGNAYGLPLLGGSSGRPDKELFIRWVQLNALMPAMQFSIVPWSYDEQTVAICRRMCELHESYGDRIVELAREATKTGAPIVRPVWWIASHDEVALTISTEFLLGDDVLVAPVLEPGARTRDVYLPDGSWQDANDRDKILTGGRWHRSYPAALDRLPYFIKI